MIDLSHIQLLAQLLDNMEIVTKSLEKSYNSNDAEMFKKTKMEMIDIQNKISKVIQ
jgi:hypothetical protein